MTVNQWLERFESALKARDADAAAALFAQDSYWRDLVAFTWNIKTVEGRDGVADLVKACDVDASGFRLTEPPVETDGVTQAWIEFETSVGRGRGVLRLPAKARSRCSPEVLTTLRGHRSSVVRQIEELQETLRRLDSVLAGAAKSHESGVPCPPT